MLPNRGASSTARLIGECKERGEGAERMTAPKSCLSPRLEAGLGCRTTALRRTHLRGGQHAGGRGQRHRRCSASAEGKPGARLTPGGSAGAARPGSPCCPSLPGTPGQGGFRAWALTSSPLRALPQPGTGRGRRSPPQRGSGLVTESCGLEKPFKVISPTISLTLPRPYTRAPHLHGF